MSGRRRTQLAAVLLAILLATSVIAQQNVQFKQQPDRVTISIGGTDVADYVYEDPQITRPYFAHVRTPSGIQVTRNYPPIDGTDVPDHATYHPGIWMAFGDISGNDYWRLKVPVRHAGFTEPPTGGAGRGSFVVRNQYVNGDDPTKVVCDERCQIAFAVRPGGYNILWDAQFSSDKQFVFGDQEEMGIGFRVATPLRVAKGNKQDDARIAPGNGMILDALGRKNEGDVWGESSSWCDYSGEIDDRLVGMTIFCHPQNFRPSWFHARDYGLLLANPFGRDAFDKGEKSRVVIEPGEILRLRYAVFVHESDVGSAPDYTTAYVEYVRAEEY